MNKESLNFKGFAFALFFSQFSKPTQNIKDLLSNLFFQNKYLLQGIHNKHHFETKKGKMACNFHLASKLSSKETSDGSLPT
jgi:hypothetical protein